MIAPRAFERRLLPIPVKKITTQFLKFWRHP